MFRSVLFSGSYRRVHATSYEQRRSDGAESTGESVTLGIEFELRASVFARASRSPASIPNHVPNIVKLKAKKGRNVRNFFDGLSERRNGSRNQRKKSEVVVKSEAETTRRAARGARRTEES